MSYCRWSCTADQSDVYVYASCEDQWVIHVAKSRAESDQPPIEMPGLDDVDAYIAAHKQLRAWLEMARAVPIPLPHAGESFYLDNPGDCADQLEKLRGLGYYMPDGVIETLREEQREMDAAP